MKLYELAEEYRALSDALDSEDAEPEQFTEALGQLQGALEDKVEAIGKVILGLRASSDAIKAEVERLLVRRQPMARKEDWLKDYLLKEMTYAKLDKVQRDLVTVSLRKAPASCLVHDMAKIPIAYRRVIPMTWEPDKRAILDLFKDTGKTVPGTEVVAEKRTVQVR